MILDKLVDGPYTVNAFGGDFEVIARLVPSGVAISAVQPSADADPIATARLIAAAPDLLALLVRALPAVRTWAGMVRRSNGTHSAKSADADNLVHEIRAALAKVRPQTNTRETHPTVMNPPVSAAEGTEAGNHTLQANEGAGCHGDGVAPHGSAEARPAEAQSLAEDDGTRYDTEHAR